jgi:exodeoxyribonuclease V
MRHKNIAALIAGNLDHKPTADQSEAIAKVSEYVAENVNDSIFLLTGYAGTGKTSLISAIVGTLDSLRIRSVLLAPTGRAAKVLSSYSGKIALTIHKKIYRQKSSKDGVGTFSLDRNLHKETYFIVDEASMIANSSADASVFGSGQLLDDLVEYVYSGTGCKLILVGDPAQLPPVGSETSPALSLPAISSYGFGIVSCELREVVRQAVSSGILMNATGIRTTIQGGRAENPRLVTNDYEDVVRISGEILIDELQAAYDKTGIEDTVVVVNSNKLANKYNQGIRSRIFFREEEIGSGDLLMIVKNNYFWLTEDDDTAEAAGFIANGDIAQVKKIRKYEERYGFRFADLTLSFPDYKMELEVKVILDTLHYDSPSMPADKNRELYFAILEDYASIKSKRKQFEAIRNDPFYNALQIKFAYAVTCHKAQGGQWRRVFIDQGMFNRQEATIEYLRWFYTAVTRATEKLYLVNFSESFFSEKG